MKPAAAPAASFCLATIVFGLLVLEPAHAQVSVCEQAGSDAERQYVLPAGLLLAIGRVESGRWDATYGRTVPWPWAIDADGAPLLAATKEEAMRQTRALQGGGLRNIDVGCFQISLLNHPDAFADLEQAFDPVANAQYAARFLTSLYARLGGWEAAVAAYHSSTPALGAPYQQAVYASWSAPVSAGGSPEPNVEPLVVYSIGGAQINVWTPSRIGTVPRLISMTQASIDADTLPRVISPGR